jgi:hypothetical protein
MIQLTDKLHSVEVPKGSKPDLIIDGNILHVIFPDKTNHAIALPPVEWEIISLASEMTEEKLEDIIPGQNFADDEVLYPKYNSKGEVLASDFCGTRLESFRSLMQSKDLVYWNTVGERPERYLGDTLRAYQHRLGVWQAAEDARKNPLILRRK